MKTAVRLRRLSFARTAGPAAGVRINSGSWTASADSVEPGQYNHPAGSLPGPAGWSMGGLA